MYKCLFSFIVFKVYYSNNVTYGAISFGSIFFYYHYIESYVRAKLDCPIYFN